MKPVLIPVMCQELIVNNGYLTGLILGVRAEYFNRDCWRSLAASDRMDRCLNEHRPSCLYSNSGKSSPVTVSAHVLCAKNCRSKDWTS